MNKPLTDIQTEKYMNDKEYEELGMQSIEELSAYQIALFMAEKRKREYESAKKRIEEADHSTDIQSNLEEER